MLCSLDLDACLSAEDVAKIASAVDRGLTGHIYVTDSTVVDCPSI